MADKWTMRKRGAKSEKRERSAEEALEEIKAYCSLELSTSDTVLALTKSTVGDEVFASFVKTTEEAKSDLLQKIKQIADGELTFEDIVNSKSKEAKERLENTTHEDLVDLLSVFGIIEEEEDDTDE